MFEKGHLKLVQKDYERFFIFDESKIVIGGGLGGGTKKF